MSPRDHDQDFSLAARRRRRSVVALAAMTLVVGISVLGSAATGATGADRPVVQGVDRAVAAASERPVVHQADRRVTGAPRTTPRVRPTPQTTVTPTTRPVPQPSTAIPTASTTPTSTPTSPAGCPSGQVGTAPACFPEPPAPIAGGKQWTVPFSEEFAGTGYDRSKLWPCFDWSGSEASCADSFNQGREHYQASQVRVSDGTAKLVAEPLSPPWTSAGCLGGSCTYKSGMLTTSRTPTSGGKYLYSFTYGYVEARMKFPATQGFFTAFWMLPADPSFSYRSEIDIAEILGNDPKTIFMNYHYADRKKNYTANNGQYNNGACAVKDYGNDFVRLGLDWQPDHIAWYIDGKKCGQFNGNASTIESGPMQIILDLMVDHQWQRDWKVGLKDPTLTRQLEVDYLRVYQQR